MRLLHVSVASNQQCILVCMQLHIDKLNLSRMLRALRGTNDSASKAFSAIQTPLPLCDPELVVVAAGHTMSMIRQCNICHDYDDEAKSIAAGLGC